jgi:hypothetical protein
MFRQKAVQIEERVEPRLNVRIMLEHRVAMKEQGLSSSRDTTALREFGDPRRHLAGQWRRITGEQPHDGGRVGLRSQENGGGHPENATDNTALKQVARHVGEHVARYVRHHD